MVGYSSVGINRAVKTECSSFHDLIHAPHEKKKRHFTERGGRRRKGSVDRAHLTIVQNSHGRGLTTGDSYNPLNM